MNWETYIALGDSITIGARTYLGYPELVGHKLEGILKKQWNVINHSVSGFKAIDLARYIDQHLSSLQQHKSSISSILIGTNDIKEKTSINDFEIALNQIILKAKLLTSNKNVLIFPIPEFHKGVMYPYSIEMNATVSIFNEKISQLAQANDLRMLELKHTEKDFTDGVHLNRCGIENFSDQISKFILRERGIDIG